MSWAPRPPISLTPFSDACMFQIFPALTSCFALKCIVSCVSTHFLPRPHRSFPGKPGSGSGLSVPTGTLKHSKLPGHGNLTQNER